MLLRKRQTWKGALLNPQRRQPQRVRHSLELLSRLMPVSVDVRGRATGTETPAVQSVAGARDFQMDIPNGSGFQKQPFWTSTGENTDDVQVKCPSLEADAPPTPDLLEIF